MPTPRPTHHHQSWQVLHAKPTFTALHSVRCECSSKSWIQSIRSSAGLQSVRSPQRLRTAWIAVVNWYETIPSKRFSRASPAALTWMARSPSFWNAAAAPCHDCLPHLARTHTRSVRSLLRHAILCRRRAPCAHIRPRIWRRSRVPARRRRDEPVPAASPPRWRSRPLLYPAQFSNMHSATWTTSSTRCEAPGICSGRYMRVRFGYAGSSTLSSKRCRAMCS
mmetsp:Transcript_13399/g.40469  ORF Transcript_13399/g.40469 Transcript_13399/m.40469 type:complete len:222 (-) Transcript_13399:182-847(-)